MGSRLRVDWHHYYKITKTLLCPDLITDAGWIEKACEMVRSKWMGGFALKILSVKPDIVQAGWRQVCT